jgi:hypothetical protein
VSETCAGTCGQVLNNCQQMVECGPCCTLTPADDLEIAINVAPAGATLRLCPGRWIVPATVEISKPITLIGAGVGKTILDGAELRRVLAITANVPVTLQGLTITQGRHATAGGGIHSAGPLTLIDAELTANATTTPSTDGGGAIFASNNLTLRNTLVRNNTSAGTGGGIRVNDGALVVENGSRIFRNYAEYGGGGIYQKGGSLTLEASSIEENTVGNPDSNRYGGGIYATCFDVSCPFTLKAGSRIHKNRAFWGGGIYLEAGKLTLEPGCQVTDNETAPYVNAGGAILREAGPVEVQEGALICGNTEPQCFPSGAITGNCPTTVDGTCPA